MSWTSLLWRNLSRNKLRSLLTGLSIALAIALVCFLATMPDGLDRLLDSAAGDTRIVVHSEAGAVYPLPRAYLQKIRAIPGVLGAASWIWFGGAYRELPFERVPQLWFQREYLDCAATGGWSGGFGPHWGVAETLREVF